MFELFIVLSLVLSKTMFVLSGLFPILNPPGHAPLFLSITQQALEYERKSIARKTAIYCFLLIIFSMLIGVYILSIFELSVNIVEVSGGMLVARLGWEMLNDDEENKNNNLPSIIEKTTTALMQKAFYPITFPLTAGPGTISVAIALSASLQASFTHPQDIITSLLGTVFASIIVCYLIYLCYAYAELISDKLGKNGTTILVKLSAFLLFCVGMQILWNGGVNLFQSIK